MATPPSQPEAVSQPAAPHTTKPIHSLVLDTGPLIKNDPPVSVLIAKAEKLYTLPSIIPEIRDAATRSRVETTLLPFVTVRSPRPDSIKFIQSFARRTGDLAVLSRPDLEVLALGYELECERNGGDWRLRKTPGQKRLNGRPGQGSEADAPSETQKPTTEDGATEEVTVVEETNAQQVPSADQPQSDALGADMQKLQLEQPTEPEKQATEGPSDESEGKPEVSPAEQVTTEQNVTPEQETQQITEVDEDDDDEDGWITPSNLKSHQAKDFNATAIPAQPEQKTLQAAVLTSDYAMQNVALRMNLNLVAPSLARITQLKNWVLRCHGCFTISRDMARQFCPSCGQPTLIRTSCSTDANGTFRVHLKRNFQWNNRGNVYSVPKPVHGSSNGRLPRNIGGGKNGWGQDLILAEDQKEFTRAADEQRRTRKKDIMDQDYLPGILSGDRGASGGRIRVGAGRNVNGKKKR